MPVLNEGRYAGEFIVSEGNGRISRETITVLSGETLAAGVLYDAVDPSAADAEGIAIVRLAEVNAAELVWPAGITAPEQTTALGELAALNIIAR